MRRFRDWVKGFWAGLRELTGDTAYERYRSRGPSPALSREEFYVDRLRRKYSRVSRCC
jgi:uncharacterized short protein YbdD (DUF466 family)